MNAQTQSRGDAAWNAVGLFGCFLTLLFYSAYVASTIWTWIMPVLFGLPALNLAQMVALRIVVVALSSPPLRPQEDPTPYRTTLFKVLTWTLLLGLAAIASAHI